MPVGHSQPKKTTHATTENNANRLLQILHCAASGQPRPAIIINILKKFHRAENVQANIVYKPGVIEMQISSERSFGL